MRVADILAALSQQKIDDNWVNKPDNSLGSILKSWLPQTAAPIERRIEVLERVTTKFPGVGWRLCLSQLEAHQTGNFNHRPTWRNDASGVGRGVPGRERVAFVRKAAELAMSWSSHSDQTLGDLVEHIQELPEEMQPRVWDLIDKWANSKNDEERKASLRERIRHYAFTRRSKARGVSEQTAGRARTALDRLSPVDPVIRHAWLFKSHWVEESIEEYDDEKCDLRAREEWIRKQRNSAISEIWTIGGVDAVSRLTEISGANHIIGSTLAELLYAREALVEPAAHFVQRAFGDHKIAYMNTLGGLVFKLDDPVALLSARIKDSAGDDGILMLFLCMPFLGATWSALNQHFYHLKDRYWSDVYPQTVFDVEADINEVIDRMVEAKRPLAAFHCVHLDWPKVETSRLKKLLRAMATTGTEPPPVFRLSSYDVAEAFKSLNSRPNVSVDELATLEFQFLAALEDGDHGIPNLERQISDSSTIFVHAVSLAFRRNDGGKDPEEWLIEDPARREAAAVTT